MEILLQNINIDFSGFFLFLLSFIIVYLMIPKLIGVIRYKNLMDYPNTRSSHKNEIPTLGGISFYVSLIICLLFIQLFDNANISINIIAALTILLIAGLKDDLVILSVRAKVLSQLLAITFLLINTDIHINNFYGFLGLREVPLWITIGFSYFAMLSIINAFNLIDGIDGLASMLGILIFSIFGVVFYSLQLYFYFLLSIVAVGFLIAFLRYNVSKKNKIFMGDTGSMITGFLIGVLSLRFLSLNEIQLLKIYIKPENLLFLTLAILFVMAIDSVRVIIIRLLNKQELFKPDRNHVHHILIDLGLSHIQSSMILTTYSIIIVAMFFVINLYLPTDSFFVLFSIAILFTIVLLFHLNKNYRLQKHKLKIKTVSAVSKSAINIKLKSLALHIFRMFF